MLALAPVSRAAAEPIRVLTFNLLHGGPVASVTGDGEHLEDRLAIVVAELRRLQPDVIALQEASIGSRRGDVALRLARELGYHAAHASTTERIFKYARESPGGGADRLQRGARRAQPLADRRP